jgi:hypothetical protein
MFFKSILLEKENLIFITNIFKKKIDSMKKWILFLILQES